MLPADVVVFKTDYDTEKELKKKYGITYQHTFVLVDNEGNSIKKWNGGGVKELIEELK
jgi:thioredoxin 1